MRVRRAAGWRVWMEWTAAAMVMRNVGLLGRVRFEGLWRGCVVLGRRDSALEEGIVRRRAVMWRGLGRSIFGWVSKG